MQLNKDKATALHKELKEEIDRLRKAIQINRTDYEYSKELQEQLDKIVDDQKALLDLITAEAQGLQTVDALFKKLLEKEPSLEKRLT